MFITVSTPMLLSVGSCSSVGSAGTSGAAAPNALAPFTAYTSAVIVACSSDSAQRVSLRLQHKLLLQSDVVCEELCTHCSYCYKLKCAACTKQTSNAQLKHSLKAALLVDCNHADCNKLKVQCVST
jgi:hypothetical protein